MAASAGRSTVKRSDVALNADIAPIVLCIELFSAPGYAPGPGIEELLGRLKRALF